MRGHHRELLRDRDDNVRSGRTCGAARSATGAGAGDGPGARRDLIGCTTNHPRAGRMEEMSHSPRATGYLYVTGNLGRIRRVLRVAARRPGDRLRWNESGDR